MPRRPSLFIGAPQEKLHIAREIQRSLQSYDVDVTIYDQNFFPPGSGTAQTLVSKACEFDFAVFVFDPVDTLESRGRSHRVPRDNVIFELGLFTGCIGSERTFFLHDASDPPKIPSDLAGITSITYRLSPGNLAASLGPACTTLCERINRLGVRRTEDEAVGRGRSSPCGEQDCVGKLNRFFKLEHFFKGDIHIYRVLHSAPVLEQLGDLALDGEQFVLAEQERTRRAKARKRDERNSFLHSNDPHAILIGDPVWDGDQVTLRYEATDYAGVWALRKRGQLPQVISASVILFSAEKEEVYLHQRPRGSSTYELLLHTFGGAFMPRRSVDNRRRDNTLLDTAKRKVWDETGLHVSCDEQVPMVLSKELKTGFIQLVLFVNLDSKEVAKMQRPLSGAIQTLRFDELRDELPVEDGRNAAGVRWVPTGKAHVLSWLALGAPGCERDFGGLSPMRLFDAIIAGERRASPG